MNRYTMSGMVADAAEGKKVAYIGRRAHRGFPSLADEAGRLGASKVYRANGRERIEFANGGRITLHRTTLAGRGVEADVVVLDPSVSDDTQTVDTALAMIAASPRGQLIRAD